MTDNILYYGDNLKVLREHMKDESVDLVYLDPPFNSNATYNVLFAEKNGSQSAAQIRAFEDTWEWDEVAARTYRDVVERGGRVSQALQAFQTFLGNNDMLAYLTMMAPRLVELRRVLKPTGSIYLHCDPTASHYLKMLMDAVFGGENFRNDITWVRTNAHNLRSRQFARVQDTILFYTKSAAYKWNLQFVAYSAEQLRRYRPEEGTGRLYTGQDLTMMGEGARNFEWRGTRPPPNRVWGHDRERLEELLAQGRILVKKDGAPRLDGLKVYLDEMPGKPVSSVWTDISRIPNTSQERLGYPTQKPEALLERIINASSNEGDVVLDPFCGCGTAIAVAQKLNRLWIGIDITHLAITLIKNRLQTALGDDARPLDKVSYRVIGEPADIAGAGKLASDDPYQFQWWALGLVGARPVEQKKGADRGIDGRLFFHDENAKGGKTKQIILSVKAGHTGVAHVRELIAVVQREDAQIGALISFQEPTGPMRAEAASAGHYESPWGKHQRIQLLTIADLLEGRRLDYPYTRHTNVTFKRAPKHVEGDSIEQTNLIGEEQ